MRRTAERIITYNKEEQAKLYRMIKEEFVKTGFSYRKLAELFNTSQYHVRRAIILYGTKF